MSRAQVVTHNPRNLEFHVSLIKMTCECQATENSPDHTLAHMPSARYEFFCLEARALLHSKSLPHGGIPVTLSQLNNHLCLQYSLPRREAIWP